MAIGTKRQFPSVKITDVAAAARVAPMTVSRVLNTPDRVSPDTAARVRDAIDALGYVPNLIAGGLSSRRSRMIAAIVPTIASSMFHEPVQSFTDAMGRAGYHVMLALSGYGGGDEATLIRAMLARQPDGLLLTGARRSPDARRLLATAHVPVVEIWDTAEQPTDMLVGFDHEEVGAEVAAFFLARGHTRFAFLGAHDVRAMARRNGFERRIAAHGGTLVPTPMLSAPSTILDSRRAFRAMAPKLAGRTALFATSDLVAFGVIMEAKLLGFSVPDQLAVCGFGNFELSRGASPAFTTVHVDGTAMGLLAAEHLVARLAGRTGAGAHRALVPFHIIERETT